MRMRNASILIYIDTMIDLQDITKSYTIGENTFQVLKGVSLSIEN